MNDIVYYTPPKKSYRVLYSSSKSAEMGVGYSPDILGVRSMLGRWCEVHQDSAIWEIQEGRDGDWTTIDSSEFISV
jgi:hypothetical protein